MCDADVRNGLFFSFGCESNIVWGKKYAWSILCELDWNRKVMSKMTQAVEKCGQLPIQLHSQGSVVSEAVTFRILELPCY